MDPSLVAQFWLVAIMLAVTPGADWAYAIAAGLRARSVVPSVTGMMFGYTVVIAIVAVGVGALVKQHPVILTVLTFAGSAYLLLLGITTLFSKPAAVEASARPIGDRPFAQFLRGAGVSGINPKGLLLLLALLPQFTSQDGWPSSAQMLALGGLHVLNCAIVYSAVGLAARRILRSRPRASIIVTRISGVIMTTIGVSILLESIAETASIG